MAKKSKEEKRLKKEAAKQEKKNKKGKKAKASSEAVVKEGNGILISILIVLLVLVGIFTLVMAGIVGWSYFRMHQARPAAERQAAISQRAPARSAQTTGFLLDGEW